MSYQQVLPSMPLWLREPWHLAHGRFGLLLFTRALLVSATFASAPFLVTMLTRSYGFSSVDAGFLATAGLIAGGVAILPAGLGVDRFGSHATLAVSSFGSMGCLTYLAAAPYVNLPVIGIAIAAQGIFSATHVASLRAAVRKMVPAPSLSTGFGMSEAARVAGKLIGPLTTMALIAAGMYRGAFMVSALLYGLGGACAAALWLSEVRGSSKANESSSQRTACVSRAPRRFDVTISALHARLLQLWGACQDIRLKPRVAISAFIVNAVACAGVVQMTTWMPKYFDELGQSGVPPVIFVLQSVFALLLLLPVSSAFKKWRADRLLLLMVMGVTGMSCSYILVSWTTTNTVSVDAGLLILGSLVVGLTVVPVVQVLVAQASTDQQTGLAFAFLGLSEVVGIVIGMGLGTQLYARAQQIGNLDAYWSTFGIVSMALVCLGGLWGLGSPGKCNRTATHGNGVADAVRYRH